MKKISALPFLVLLFSFCSLHAKEIKLSEVVSFKVGDKYKLQESEFFVEIGKDKGTECAVPGRNCGAGYIPPHPIFKVDCGQVKKCPFIVLSEIKTAESGILSIESEATCLKNKPEICFSEFAKTMKSGQECLDLKSAVGQYYCLERFPQFKSDDIKTLCDKLPFDIYALQWNCFYNYAFRFNDEKFCEKYSLTEEGISGKNRCYLKIAQLLNNKKLCEKIVKTSSDSYLEQCLQ